MADSDSVPETCPRCRGWVWHRREPCNCKAGSPPPTARDIDFLPALGRRLRALRQSRGLSLDALATRAGMSKTGIWDIEKGKHEPMAWTLVTLANVLGVTTDYLLLREG